MAKSIGGHLGQARLDCFYSIYREANPVTFSINGTSGSGSSSVTTKVMNKAKLLASYPFLWTLLLLHWYYGATEQDTSDSPPPAETSAQAASDEPLPDKVLQVYLCVWHDAVGFCSVARRESPVPTSALLAAPALPIAAPPFEAPMAIWARLDWDLLSTSNRIVEGVQKRIRL
jgi:hypothetical protein